QRADPHHVNCNDQDGPMESSFLRHTKGGAISLELALKERLDQERDALQKQIDDEDAVVNDFPRARLIGGLYTVQGLVRKLCCRRECSDITFEHENHEVSLIEVYGKPSVCAGEHVRLTLR